MRTTVYIYVKDEQKAVNLQSFYVLKNKKEYEMLIDKLLELDAVIHPYSQEELDKVKFPIILRPKEGFCFDLTAVTKSEMLKELKQEKKLIEKLENSIA